MIRHLYTLVCDLIRFENTGKVFIIGLYTPDIVVPGLPATLPSLALFVCLESDEVTTLQVTFQLLHGTVTITQGSAQVDVLRPGMVALPIQLGPTPFAEPGTYRFTLDIAGRAETIETSFQVQLQAQGPTPAIRI